MTTFQHYYENNVPGPCQIVENQWFGFSTTDGGLVSQGGVSIRMTLCRRLSSGGATEEEKYRKEPRIHRNSYSGTVRFFRDPNPRNLYPDITDSDPTHSTLVVNKHNVFTTQHYWKKLFSSRLIKSTKGNKFEFVLSIGNMIMLKSRKDEDL
jgi:hypothetical protein